MAVKKLAFAVSLAALGAAPVRADWREASSDHFVVYADAGEAELVRFATNLERYHAALALVTGAKNAVPSPSNRVTVYAVGSFKAVQNLISDKARAKFVGGFYRPRAGATMAVVPDLSSARNADTDRELATFLHEYAHHFLISGSTFPMPNWANEGAAEFFASAGFEKDGGMTIGRPNPLRLHQLQNMPPVPAAALFDPATPTLGKTSFYARSWLFYHYLVMGGPRKGQLTAYFDALTTGQKSVDAARAVFGDPAVLDKELEKYAVRHRFTTIVIKGRALPVGAVTARLLGPGEAAGMGLRVRQHNGLGRDEVAEVAAGVRQLAARYPDEAMVQAMLAEAEYDAGNDNAALAAADAALRLDPRQVKALVQKGLTRFRLAGKSGAAADYKTARDSFVDLNHLENDHPLPLIYYYRSFEAQRKVPSPLAVQGLERAAELAPYDLALRMNLALQQLRDGRAEAARLNLMPVAYAPHGGRMAAAARAVLDKLAADPAWRGQGQPRLPGGEEEEEPDPA